jgi:CRP-like cAMP-binding protein
MERKPPHLTPSQASPRACVSFGSTASPKGAFGMLRINNLLSNKILTALPGEDFQRLVPHLEPVTLAAGQTLLAQGETTHLLYFPESCVVSAQCGMSDGKSVEVGMIGREGIAGLNALFGPAAGRQEVSVAVGGSALRARPDELRREFERGGRLRQLLEQFSGEYAAHVSQRAACNALHSIEKRLAVWLLLLTERLGADTVEMTHERIASHLGVRRAGVTVIAGDLHDKGVVANTRGSLRVADRAALESSACECYWALKGAARQQPTFL